MTRSAVETILGGLVIVIAIWFLAFSYHAGHSGSTGEGFEVYADFSGIGGLKAGDAVEISGVKVGSVQAVDLVPDNYLARSHEFEARLEASHRYGGGDQQRKFIGRTVSFALPRRR